MSQMWMNFLVEIGFLSLLGILYYFYQKRKILKFEANKTPYVMNFILQSCLSEKKDSPQENLDNLISSLDDFLSGKTNHAPLSLLLLYVNSPDCSSELKQIILEGLHELGIRNEEK